MSTFWHRVGVYLGLAEQRPEEQAAASAQPRPSWRRRLVAVVFVIVVAGVVTAVIDGSAWTGIRFAVFFLLLRTAWDLFERRQLRLDGDA